MKKRKVLVITGVIVVAAALLLAATIGNRGIKPEVVKTAIVSKGDLKSYLSTNAVIKSKNSKSYMGATQLTVKMVNVKIGDSVKQGGIMLEYDLSDLNTSVSQAKLQYNNAVLQKNELSKQKDQLDKTIANLDTQIKQLEGSQNPTDIAQLQILKQKREALQPISDEKLQLSNNAVALAKLTFDSAASKLAKYSDGIVAEFDGVVTSLNAIEGSVVSPSQPAIVVQQLDNLKAIISLGKYDALKVKVGQEAVLKSGDKAYNGTVSFLSPAAASTMSASGQETSLQAEVDILDKSTDLKVDFDTNVDILLGSAAGVVKIPVECIKYDKSGKNYVFTIVDGKAKQLEVKLGLQSDMEAQVISGLSEGDRVILNPNISIADGTVVKVNEGVKQ